MKEEECVEVGILGDRTNTCPDSVQSMIVPSEPSATSFH